MEPKETNTQNDNLLFLSRICVQFFLLNSFENIYLLLELFRQWGIFLFILF